MRCVPSRAIYSYRGNTRVFGVSVGRAGGIAGIVFVVVLVGAGFIVPAPPAADDPASEYLEYLSENRTALMMQASITVVLSVPLFAFAACLAQWLRDPRSDAAAISMAAAGAIAAGWVVATPLSLAYGGLAYLADGRLEEADALSFMLLVTVAYGATVVLLGTGALLSGAALVAGSGARRWVGWFGVVAAALAAVAVFGWADSGLFSPGQPLFIGYLALMAYLLAVSVLMVRTSRP